MASSVSPEQLQAFVAKYETAPVVEVSTIIPILGTDSGSFTHEKLGELLARWADANPDFSYEQQRTSKGLGFAIRCPGENGWADGAQHSDRSSKLTSSAVVWVSPDGHPRFRCGHSHCDAGAATAKKTWKHLVQALDPGGRMQNAVLTGVVRLLPAFTGPEQPEKMNSPQAIGEPTEDRPWAIDIPVREHSQGPAGYTPLICPSGNDSEFANSELASQVETPSISFHNGTISTEEGSPRYPLEVWAGTEYADFAERACRGNFIPPEFFIEAIKTYTGAIAGPNMFIDGLDGGNPRFYTIMLAGPGKGKNTVIDWTQDFFKAEGLYTQGAWPANALVWYPQHKIETRQWKSIGVCRAKVSSASGLARCLPRLDKKGAICNSPQERILMVYSELAEVFEKFGIEGSGGAMMSAFCDLYDTEDFTVPALADLDSFGGRLQFSMLAGIQPRKWDIVCAGKGIEGSGLDERFNLVPTTDPRTVASLTRPDWTGLKTPFLERIHELESMPYMPPATPEAKALAEEAHRSMQPPPDDDNAPSAGRLNILAWRNALHMAWLGRRPAVDADCMDRALRISRWQLGIRRLYKPLQGDNATARAANAIQRHIEKQPVGSDIKFRDLERAVNANRMGPIFDAGLAHLQTRGRVILHDQDVPTGGGIQKIRYVRRID
jgi:hypothetical protein